MAGCADLVQSGSIRLLGWVEEVKDFYEQISLYVQSSASEGFGLEVLEAMAHGRIALCSNGAGAADIVPERWVFPARDVGALCTLLDSMRSAMTKYDEALGKVSLDVRYIASQHTWNQIRERYKKLWKELLKERVG
jgi:glycosyltransferase involved in cell wall biosynthesis